MCSIKYNLNALFLEHNKQFEHNIFNSIRFLTKSTGSQKDSSYILQESFLEALDWSVEFAKQVCCIPMQLL